MKIVKKEQPELRQAFYTWLFYEVQYNPCFFRERKENDAKGTSRPIIMLEISDHERDTRMHLLFATWARVCTEISVSDAKTV
jgi:hypothetical protein